MGVNMAFLWRIGHVFRWLILGGFKDLTTHPAPPLFISERGGVFSMSSRELSPVLQHNGAGSIPSLAERGTRIRATERKDSFYDFSYIDLMRCEG